MKKLLSINLISIIITACCNSNYDQNECTASETIAVTKSATPEGDVKDIECYINDGRQYSPID